MGTVVSTLLAPASSLAIRESKKTLHGALMIWAWGVFIPSGMLLVRAYEHSLLFALYCISV
jgi:hypothetical protein